MSQNDIVWMPVYTVSRISMIMKFKYVLILGLTILFDWFCNLLIRYTKGKNTTIILLTTTYKLSLSLSLCILNISTIWSSPIVIDSALQQRALSICPSCSLCPSQWWSRSPVPPLQAQVKTQIHWASQISLLWFYQASSTSDTTHWG